MMEKKKIRNKNLRDYVRMRDMGLCRCCGFKGDEAHHIKPLAMQGQDKINNMVWVCGECHRYAPNDKQSFFEYMLRGGSRIERLMGSIIISLEEKEMDFHIYYPIMKQMIKFLRNCDTSLALEKYDLALTLEMGDVDFSKEQRNYNNNKQTHKLKKCQVNI